MQKDMHYYGVYALAMAAGLNTETAKTIATASQFVDDAADYAPTDVKDGGCFYLNNTAHEVLNVIKNDKPVEQRNVWVPFHFLPGNQGKTFEEKLACQKDSDIARQVVQNHLSLCKKPFGRELLGLTAHVYADTFSHYGFAGISCENNMVKPDSIDCKVKDKNIFEYISEKASNYIKGFAAEAASVGLGHSGTATNPDRPYLKWNFTYMDGRSSSRDNSETFMQASEALYNLFSNFRKLCPEYASEGGRSFGEIKDSIYKIISLEGRMEDRIEAWKTSVSKQELFYFPGEATIPDYNSSDWTGVQLKDNDCSELTRLSIYRFDQASVYHKYYVLRELLPEHGLLVA